MFTRILFPTKFDEFSLPTLQSITCLKRAGLKEVVLLHVIDSGILHYQVDGEMPIAVEVGQKAIRDHLELLREKALERLSSFAEHLRLEGIEATWVVAMGKVVTEILKVAKDKHISVIVAGRQKRDILGELFVGSTTDRIIRKAEVPVLVAKYHTLMQSGSEVYEHFCLDMFNKILFPTDWSPCAERAKDFLSSLGRVGATEILVTHVIEDIPKAYDISVPVMEQALATLGKKAGDDLKSLAQELQSYGFKVSTRILYGEPYREIIRVAREENVSMIVMGSHGRGFVKGIFWGNVSQWVVEYSEKPVLVVK
jgi:nucleotide-binding universal stress UspA family protein